MQTRKVSLCLGVMYHIALYGSISFFLLYMVSVSMFFKCVLLNVLRLYNDKEDKIVRDFSTFNIKILNKYFAMYPHVLVWFKIELCDKQSINKTLFIFMMIFWDLILLKMYSAGVRSVCI